MSSEEIKTIGFPTPMEFLTKRYLPLLEDNIKTVELAIQSAEEELKQLLASREKLAKYSVEYTKVIRSGKVARPVPSNPSQLSDEERYALWQETRSG